MTEAKTRPTNQSVSEFLDGVKHERRLTDSKVLLKMMRRVSRKKPVMWGSSIIGFGKHTYTLASGKQGEMLDIGFAPRSQALVLYLGHFKDRAKHLKKLGKHKEGSGACIYINKLDDVDLDVLEQMVTDAFQSSGGDR